MPDVTPHMQGRIRLVAEGGDVVSSWPLPPGPRTDLGTVDALARWRLLAQRRGLTMRVDAPCPVLVELLRLCGLAELLLDPDGSVEVGGKPEGCEQLRVEEAVVADDPLA